MLDSSTSVERQIISEDIDIGILFSTNPAAGVKYEPISRELLAVALPIGHPLARSTTITFKDLLREPFVIFPRRVRPYMFDQIISWCHQAHFSPTIAQEATTEAELIGLVAAGLGVALVSKGHGYLWSDKFVSVRPV